MTDAWHAVHGPADRTPTFDPSVNPLAAVSSLTGRVSRLDRVLLRAHGLRARTADLTGDAPGPAGLYISAHYGVRVELAPAAELPAGAEPGTAARCPAGAKPTTTTRLPASDGVGHLVERVAAALPGARVHLVGSRRTGCALPGADLDLVAALPGAPDPARLRHRLAATLPGARDLREVTGARVPGLRWHLDGLRVDLVTVATGALSPADTVARRAELGDAAAVALSDAEAGAPGCRIWPNPITAGGRTGYAIGLGATGPDGPRPAETGAQILRGIRDASLAPVSLSALRSNGDAPFAL